jgi:hypothetical protein
MRYDMNAPIESALRGDHSLSDGKRIGLNVASADLDWIEAAGVGRATR